MKILDIRTTDGPNYWSIKRQQLVVMTLDLEEMEEQPTHKIPGFYDRIRTMLPTLYTHRCSEGEPGGFFRRVEAGTWMGHVIEHIALELQTLAGMETGFGRTREAGKRGVYFVVFTYVDAAAGRYAAEASVAIARALIAGESYDVGRDIRAMRDIAAANRPGPSTMALIEEARRRDIPVMRLNEDAYFQLGYGAAQRRIEAAVTSTTSNIAVEIAADKAFTKRMLKEAGLPVPEGAKAGKAADLKAIIDDIGFPMAIKPLDGNHGRGATLDIRDEATAYKALAVALEHSREAVCEKFICGSDFRILVVDYKMVAAAFRKPACVTGDGVHTIAELIERVNQDPRRGKGHDNVLTRIELDACALALLDKQGLRQDDVPVKGMEVWLKATANLSTGGTAYDVTDKVHPGNKALFERAARVIGLDICGIDVIAPELVTPLAENGGVILEVNAGPGLRMHLQPTGGMARNVAAPIIDMLFPHGSEGRIPIVGITGTNGKTTTTRLIAHIGRKAGYTVGCTTTDGVYIDGHLVQEGDCTGPLSTRMVLRDPSVNLAVLECARGGIIRAGLGFDKCDIAVITNIAEDHLGMNGIDTVEKLTRVKATLAEAVCIEGYAVLNADDDRVYALRDRLHCGIALFSMDADSGRIRDHVRAGGMAAVYDNGHISIIHEGIINRITPAQELPVTFGGHAAFNIRNVLAATMAAFIQGVDIADIHHALLTFMPSPEQLPGRMNLFDFGAYKIIVDYAHNAHGLQAISEFLQTMPAAKRVGVVAGVGDRRDEDIIALGAAAARIFDEIIIRQDDDLRGRKADEVNGLVYKGICQVAPGKKVTVIPDEKESALAVLERAERGMVATIFADDVEGVIQVIKNALASGNYIFQEKELA